MTYRPHGPPELPATRHSSRAGALCHVAFLALAALPAAPVAAASVELSASGPIVVSNENDVVIENLSIEDDGSRRCAVDISDANRVVIRNLDIRHANIGICTYQVENLVIENVRMASTTALASGPFCRSGVSECATDRDNWIKSPDTKLAIKLDRSPGARIDRISATRASSGVFVHRSDDVELSNVVCEDIRGPFPRGQCVIFVYSDDGSLTNFYSKAYKEKSHAEDNINAYDSDGITISEGLVDGNWSRHGVGVIADQGSDDMTIRNVDVTNTGVAATSVYSNDLSIVGRNFTAENVRVKNTHCDARYGGVPSSGGLVFVAHPNAPNPRYINAQYYNHCRSAVNWCMPGASCREVGGGSADIREEDFTLREPLRLVFPWEDGEDGASAPSAAPDPADAAPTIISVTVEDRP